MTFASKAKLSDSADAAAYRAKYNYTAAKKAPSVIPCDVSTSDVYFSGKILGDAFENFTSLITNNTAAYCTTAQEDTATLEAMVRAAKFKKVDYSRVIIMRTAAAYDRPPPGETAFQHLFYTDTAGFEPSLNNIYLAGVQVVKGITANWDAKYKNGIKATNYVGDIFGTLGGVPDFGPYPNFGEA